MNIQEKKIQRRIKLSEDPYKYLVLGILRQAFSDIKCYYSNSGMRIEIKNGKIAERWIKQQEGSFSLVKHYLELEDRRVKSGNYYVACLDVMEQFKSHTHDELYDPIQLFMFDNYPALNQQ